MADLLEITGAMGPAIAQAGKDYRGFATELTNERMRGEELALREQDLRLRQNADVRADEQLEINKQTARAAAEKAAQDKELFDQGNTPIDPEDYLTMLGLGPRAKAAYISEAKKRGLLEPLKGRLIVRQRNIEKGLTAIHNDPDALANILQGEINDVEEAQKALFEKSDKIRISGGPADPKLQEAMQRLAEQKAAAYQSWEYAEEMKAKKTTVPSVATAIIKQQPVSPEKHAQNVELKTVPGKVKGEEDRKTLGVKHEYTMKEIAAKNAAWTARYEDRMKIMARYRPITKASMLHELFGKLIAADGWANMDPVDQQQLEFLTGMQQKELINFTNMLKNNLNLQAASSPEEFDQILKAGIEGLKALRPYANMSIGTFAGLKGAQKSMQKGMAYDPNNPAHAKAAMPLIQKWVDAGDSDAEIHKKIDEMFRSGTIKVQ